MLADFGIAKTLDSKHEVLTSMAGSFGYAAPEIMLRQGHGKAVDMWSMGVITYTLLCGYSPFRSENMTDLIHETSSGKVVFHERYWRDVSKDAKDFIRSLLQPSPQLRPTSKVPKNLFQQCTCFGQTLTPWQQALQHRWLTGLTATDHNIVSELRSRRIKARLRLGVERVKLAKRIDDLRIEEDNEEGDIPSDAASAADEALGSEESAEAVKSGQSRLSKAVKGDIFRAVVMAKTKELKQQKETESIEKTAASTGKLGK